MLSLPPPPPTPKKNNKKTKQITKDKTKETGTSERLASTSNKTS